MELVAVLVKVTPEEKGKTQSGQDWKRRTAIFETVGDSRFKRQVAVTCVNQMSEVVGNYQPGNLLKVQVDPDSHEHEKKWYTELRAWSIKPAYTIATEHPQQTASVGPATQEPEMMLDENGQPVPVP